MDRRIQKTKNGIYQAFAKLLQKESYSKITIQQIIDEANIGRSTFYSHFNTKDELIEEMCNEIFEHITTSLKNEKTHNFSIKENTTLSMITHILYHLKDEKNEILPILSSDCDYIFLNYFRTYFNDFVKTKLLQDFKVKRLNVPDNFLINHITESFLITIKWWSRNKMKNSPEEIATYFYNVMP